MLKICLGFWKSEPQYAYKLYAYKKKHVIFKVVNFIFTEASLFSPIYIMVSTLFQN